MLAACTIAVSVMSAIVLGGYRAAWADSLPCLDDDIRVMALNMYHEARGEGELGMLAVGWVVLNRMADKAYPEHRRRGDLPGLPVQLGMRSAAPTVRGTKRSWRRALELAADAADRRRAGSRPAGRCGTTRDWVRDPGFGPRVSAVTRIGRHVFYAASRCLSRWARRAC